MAIAVCFLFFALFMKMPTFLDSSSVFAAEPRPLVFGRVFDDPVRTIKDRQEFVDYLGKKLEFVGFNGARIVVFEKLHLLARAVREGHVDLFHDSVVPTIVLSKSSGSIPMLRQWKYGEAEYDAVIVVRKGSGISTLSDLKGKVIAFDEPHSTSAHILPRMLFAENKIQLVPLLSSVGAPPNKVGYVYGSDGTSANLLIAGRADAAATSSREFDELRPAVRETLRVIGRTRSVARQLISIRKDLDRNVANALREILLNMDKDAAGREVLANQQRTTKIDEIPPKSLEQFKIIETFVFSTLGTSVDSW